MKVVILIVTGLILFGISMYAYTNLSFLSSISAIESQMVGNNKMEKNEINKLNNLGNTLSSPLSIELGWVPNVETKQCIKGEPCKFRVLLRNSSDSDLDITELNFIMRPYSENPKIDFRNQINSVIDLKETLNLIGDARTLNLKTNEKVETEFNLASLTWQRSISSVLDSKPLWSYVSEGKYQLFADARFLSKSHDYSRRNATIGNTDVVLEDFTSAKSNLLTVETKK